MCECVRACVCVCVCACVAGGIALSLWGFGLSWVQQESQKRQRCSHLRAQQQQQKRSETDMQRQIQQKKEIESTPRMANWPQTGQDKAGMIRKIRQREKRRRAVGVRRERDHDPATGLESGQTDMQTDRLTANKCCVSRTPFRVYLYRTKYIAV